MSRCPRAAAKIRQANGPRLGISLVVVFLPRSLALEKRLANFLQRNPRAQLRMFTKRTKRMASGSAFRARSGFERPLLVLGLLPLLFYARTRSHRLFNRSGRGIRG